MNKMYYLLGIGFILCLFSCNKSSFDHYHCEGYVKDVNGEPIAYVRVRVPIDTIHKESIRTFTDANGYYQVQLPAYLKKMRIGFTHGCYKPTTDAIGSSCVKDTVLATDDLNKNNRRVKMPDIILKLHARPTSVVIRGRILDEDTGEPIAGVDNISSSGLIYAITNGLGYYDIMWVPPVEQATLRLDFVKEGYERIIRDTLLVAKKGTILYLPDLTMKRK